MNIWFVNQGVYSYVKINDTIVLQGNNSSLAVGQQHMEIDVNKDDVITVYGDTRNGSYSFITITYL